MDKYKEYSNVNGKWIENGFVSINGDKIESEKNVSIEIDGEPKVIKVVRLVSGTLHYVDTGKVNEEPVCYPHNQIQRRWGIIKKDGKIEKSSFCDCWTLYEKHYDNWEDLNHIIDSYIDERRWAGKFTGTVKILFTEDFEYVKVIGNNAFRWKGDSVSIMLKCKECVIQKGKEYRDFNA